MCLRLTLESAPFTKYIDIYPIHTPMWEFFFEKSKRVTNQATTRTANELVWRECARSRMMMHRTCNLSAQLCVPADTFVALEQDSVAYILYIIILKPRVMCMAVTTSRANALHQDSLFVAPRSSDSRICSARCKVCIYGARTTSLFNVRRIYYRLEWAQLFARE